MQSHLKKSKVIVVIATGWGPLYGGINSFSFDFSLELGRILRGSVRVICLTTNVDDIIRSKVIVDHVEIFTLPHVGPGNEREVASNAREVLNQHGITAIDLVFGHDVVTGPAAIELVNLIGGKISLFHHMSYIQYQGLKKDGKTAIEMQSSQKEVLKKAHYVIAVGPLLKESAQRLLLREVPMVVPGIAAIDPATHRVNGDFRAITFGRMGGEDDPIKQGSLAVAGYGRYVKQSHEKQVDRTHGFTIYGLSQDEYEAEEQAIKKLMEKEADRQIIVNATTYTNNRQELFTALATSDVALMLSWHEGFGLVGWEAIAAGVPLVLSKQTGLYKLLDAPNELGGVSNVSVVDVRGSDGGVPNDKDVESVAAALFQISTNWEKFQQKAITLRNHLKKKYTWEGCVNDALKACEFSYDLADTETAQPLSSPTAYQSSDSGQHTTVSNAKTADSNKNNKISHDEASQIRVDIGDIPKPIRLYREYVERDWNSRWISPISSQYDGQLPPFIEDQKIRILELQFKDAWPMKYLRVEHFRRIRAESSRRRQTGLHRGHLSDFMRQFTEKQSGATSEREVWKPISREDIISHLLSRNDRSRLHRTVVATDAGVGKTTNLQWINHALNSGPSNQLALLIDVADLPTNPNDFLAVTLVSLLRKAKGNDSINLSQEVAELILNNIKSQGRLVLIIDALDQIQASEKSCLHTLKQLLADENWNSCHIVLGSRPFALALQRIHDFKSPRPLSS